MSFFKKFANACRVFNGEVDTMAKELREERNKNFEKEWNEHNCWNCRHLRRWQDCYRDDYVCVASNNYGQKVGTVGLSENKLKEHDSCSDFEKKRTD